MLTAAIFFFLLIIPLLYCIGKSELYNFVYYAILVYWIPITLPIGGIIEGITLSEAIVYFALLFYALKHGEKIHSHSLRLRPSLKLGYLLIAIGAVLSVMHSVSPKFLFIGFRQNVVFPIIFLFLISRIVNERDKVFSLLTVFFISTIVLLVVLLLYPKTSEFYYGRAAWGEVGRLGGEYKFFGKYKGTYYESTVGAFLGFISPLIFSLGIYASNKAKRYFNLLLFLVLVLFLILTAGRAGWVACVIGCSAVVLARVKSLSKFLIRLVAAIIIAGAAIVAVSYFVENSDLKRTLLLRLLSFTNILHDPNFLVRAFQWLWGLQVFRSNIWGIGLWNFGIFTGERFAGNSTWVNLLLDLGFLGTIGFLILYLDSLKWSFRIAIREKSDAGLYIGILASLLSFSISAITENLLQSSFYTLFAFWMLIGFSQALTSLNEESYKIAQQ